MVTIYDVLFKKVDLMIYNLTFISSFYMENEKQDYIQTIVHEYWAINKYQNKSVFTEKIKKYYQNIDERIKSKKIFGRNYKEV